MVTKKRENAGDEVSSVRIQVKKAKCKPAPVHELPIHETP